MAEKDLTYRKSRYDALKQQLDKEYKDTFVEIDTSNIASSKTGLNYIDLFAGAGGLSLGIKQAGFNKLCDVEILPFAVETLKSNFEEAIHFCGDIADFHPKELVKGESIDLVVGGPPCQGFSVAGKRDVSDQRNFLFGQFLRVVEETKPIFFVLENVPGIITLKNGEFYHKIVQGFTKLGYTVSVRILEAADYGVPQLRTRAIFIGNRRGIKNPYPTKLLTPRKYKTINDAIYDLEDKPRGFIPNHEWTKHSKKIENRIKTVLPGESLYDTFSDAYKRQRIGEPCMAIKENHGGTHIHYKLNRCISVREMARLQSFPDSFVFKGTYKQGFIQVGNAVPPLLAQNVGLAVKKAILDNTILEATHTYKSCLLENAQVV